jgi:Bacteriophage head to tail connecting protein
MDGTQADGQGFNQKDFMLNDTDGPLGRVRKRYEAMRRQKSPWITIYDLLARYILGRRNFMTHFEMLPEDYFDPYIFDSTAISANHLLASSNVGALWPNGAKTFMIDIVPEMVNEIQDTDEVKQYFDFVTQTLVGIMDNPKSGFLTTFEEYMIEQGAFGTSAIIVEEEDDLHCPVVYRPVSARDIFIDLDGKYRVDTVYIRRRMTLRMIEKEYGSASFEGQEVEALQDYSTWKRYDVIVAIQPRENWDPNSPTNLDFPYSSIHIDYTRNKLLKESGYKELPVFVGRFWHTLNEVYGRSPGMVALADIRELNELRFQLIQAGEKMLFPPVTVIDGCLLGNYEVDLSAKGLNVVAPSGKMNGYNGKPIEQTIDIENPQWAFTRLQDLIELVKNHFFLDRIMDLNNETRMTLGEANIRNELRGQSLNTIYTRQEKEVIEPMIERTFNICLGKGLLGVVKGSMEEAKLLAQGIQPRYIPDPIAQRMMKGQDVYKVRFISPASQIKQANELQGINTVLQSAQQIAQASPEAAPYDHIDLNFTLDRIAQLGGAPQQMIQSQQHVAELQQQRQQAQEQQQQMEQLQQGAQAAQAGAKAHESMSNAQQSQQGGGGNA